MSQKVPSCVLAYDLGGTKVAVGVVNARGRVLREIREPAMIGAGKPALMRQLADLGKMLLKDYPGAKKVGFASAGPLDPDKGILLDPTNFKTNGKTWGKVPISRVLSQKLKRSVYLENDAAAAILAECWVGAAKGYKSAMILTLGTGLGTGIVLNGELLRAGRDLHTEAGHMILNIGDTSALCGCGNYGCAEAYLSGNGFGRRAAKRLGNPNLTAKDVADLARRGDRKALEAFDEYAMIMAHAIHNYVLMFAPEIIVFTGSFAGAADLFMDKTQRNLEKLLERRREGTDMMPVLALSALENMAGLIGGAYVAFHRR